LGQRFPIATLFAVVIRMSSEAAILRSFAIYFAELSRSAHGKTF
jgi:hypothetical protein